MKMSNSQLDRGDDKYWGWVRNQVEGGPGWWKRRREDDCKQMERRFVSIKMGISTYKKRPVLLFEGWNDAANLLDFSRKIGFLNGKKNVDFVPSDGVDNAIKNHREALELGFSISTIVDMDFDFSNNRIEGIENIRTTHPKCTLFTYFIETNKEEKLNELIKFCFDGNISDDVAKKCGLLAKKRTRIRLRAGLTKHLKKKKKNKHEIKKFIEKWNNENSGSLSHVLNDHSLIEAIYATKDGLDKIPNDWKLNRDRAFELDKKMWKYITHEMKGEIEGLLVSMYDELKLNSHN